MNKLVDFIARKSIHRKLNRQSEVIDKLNDSINEMKSLIDRNERLGHGGRSTYAGKGVEMLESMVCRYADFAMPWYKEQELSLRIREIFAGHSAAQVDFVNRKFWEWCAISQVLDERCKLRTGMTGLGFAVGTEPLASHFASRGCQIRATDLAPELSDGGWIATGQHASAKGALLYPALVNPAVFDARVEFQAADMRTLDGIDGKYDFIWSSCALEHLGSLTAGIDFIIKSSSLLKSGGIAVHTTEFNTRSNNETIEFGPSVIYREQDILDLRQELSRENLTLFDPNFDIGHHACDLDYDAPPYMTSGKPHLKIEIDGHICTSMLLVIER